GDERYPAPAHRPQPRSVAERLNNDGGSRAAGAQRFVLDAGRAGGVYSEPAGAGAGRQSHEDDMSNAAISARRAEAVARGVGVTTQVYVERAKNAELWDVEGRRYIDFAAGIAVVNTGHLHPRVVAAVNEQLTRFTHTCHQV